MGFDTKSEKKERLKLQRTLWSRTHCEKFRGVTGFGWHCRDKKSNLVFFMLKESGIVAEWSSYFTSSVFRQKAFGVVSEQQAPNKDYPSDTDLHKFKLQIIFFYFSISKTCIFKSKCSGLINLCTVTEAQGGNFHWQQAANMYNRHVIDFTLCPPLAEYSSIHSQYTFDCGWEFCAPEEKESGSIETISSEGKRVRLHANVFCSIYSSLMLILA